MATLEQVRRSEAELLLSDVEVAKTRGWRQLPYSCENLERLAQSVLELGAENAKLKEKLQSENRAELHSPDEKWWKEFRAELVANAEIVDRRDHYSGETLTFKTDLFLDILQDAIENLRAVAEFDPEEPEPKPSGIRIAGHKFRKGRSGEESELCAYWGESGGQCGRSRKEHAVS